VINVYLSGASREAKRVRMWADKLEQTGRMRITHKWFADAEKWAGQDAKTQRELTREEVAKIATEDLDGVAAADIVWMLWPKAPTIGAYVELGAALERKRMLAEIAGVPSIGPFALPRIIITGPGFADSIFSALVDYREITDALGFHEATRIANDLTRARKSAPRAAQ
jgi:hypothetical protein